MVQLYFVSLLFFIQTISSVIFSWCTLLYTTSSKVHTLHFCVCLSKSPKLGYVLKSINYYCVYVYGQRHLHKYIALLISLLSTRSYIYRRETWTGLGEVCQLIRSTSVRIWLIFIDSERMKGTVDFGKIRIQNRNTDEIALRVSPSVKNVLPIRSLSVNLRP